MSESYSEWVNVLSGIPQGSVLGPLLFLIFVNDIQDSCHLGSSLYADDSKLFRHIKISADTNKLQSDLDGLKEWFNKWQLKLNINKCKIVSYSRKSINVNDYFIDTTTLEHATTYKHK